MAAEAAGRLVGEVLPPPRQELEVASAGRPGRTRNAARRGELMQSEHPLRHPLVH